MKPVLWSLAASSFFQLRIYIDYVYYLVYVVLFMRYVPASASPVRS